MLCSRILPVHNWATHAALLHGNTVRLPSCFQCAIPTVQVGYLLRYAVYLDNDGGIQVVKRGRL